MASETVYTCDHCGKKIDDLYGPLIIEIVAIVEPLCLRAETCGFDCAQAWLADKSNSAR